MDPVSAYDAAFVGRSGHVVDHVGRTEPFDVGQWSCAPDWVDRSLFIDPCDGATIDVGCGPGRLVGRAGRARRPGDGHRRVDRGRPADPGPRRLALRRDVFGSIPGEGGGRMRCSPTAISASAATRYVCWPGSATCCVAGGTVIAEVAEPRRRAGPRAASAAGRRAVVGAVRLGRRRSRRHRGRRRGGRMTC